MVWFLDIAKVIKLAIKANAREAEADAQQNEVLVQELGVLENGLKSVGGSFTLGSGNYDSLSKTFFLAPKPVHGLLKIFSFPPVSLRPESWVPATVASYQTMSFGPRQCLQGLSNDLVNKFQPGMLNIVEQQLVGPNGGPAAEPEERCLRAARRSHHDDQRLQEADQGRQPKRPPGHRTWKTPRPSRTRSTRSSTIAQAPTPPSASFREPRSTTCRLPTWPIIPPLPT